MITIPDVTIPADVMRDCAPGAPVPATVAAHARVVNARRQAGHLQTLPPALVNAAPMQAAHLQAGDVIRHPGVAGAFLRITTVESYGHLFGYALHHATGYLDGRVTPVRLPATQVIAVWNV